MNEQKLRAGDKDGSIPSMIADTAATSSIGITKDRNKHTFVPTPNGTMKEATDVNKLNHDVHHLAKDIHIVPEIECNSPLSKPKFVDANYIAIFDKDKINIYNTKVTISCSAILCGWQCKDTNLWCVPLLPFNINNNMDTVLCN